MNVQKVFILLPSVSTECHIFKKTNRMEKLQVSNILVKDAKLTAIKIDERDPRVIARLESVEKQQEEAIKLKRVDMERLRMVVQL